MSQANSDLSPLSDPQQQAPRYRKPRADVYTMLLLVAWIAILLGILMLYLEMKVYDFEFRRVPAMLNSPAPVRATMLSRADWTAEDSRCGEPLSRLQTG